MPEGVDTKKILMIAPYVPYQDVPHAGGKILFDHLRSLLAKNFEVHLITVGKADEIEKAQKYWKNLGVDTHFLSYPPANAGLFNRFLYLISFFTRKIPGINIFWNPYFAHNIPRMIKELCRLGVLPDIVVIEWTEFTPFIRTLKKTLPQNAVFIAVEHDVTFQRYSRKSQASSFPLNFAFFAIYLYVKKREVNLLSAFDLVLTFNSKDSKLLKDNGIPSSKIQTLTPYFQRYFSVRHNLKNKDGLVFFGAMNRKENVDAVLWFVQNVWPFLKQNIPGLKFYVVGANPRPEIQFLKNQPGIIVTDFVPDPAPYFEKAFAGIAPLRLGAGIKIKVLEMMSAGLPVLTNEVGIEGIPAVRNEHYLHCDCPEDYLKSIHALINSSDLFWKLSVNAQNFVKKVFDETLNQNKFEEIIP